MPLTASLTLIHPPAATLLLLVILPQCVEIDFQYPSEGIHARWEQDYRITSVAATHEQTAFILSRMRKSSPDDTQETLRTTGFPTDHVKDKWENNMYISAIAFGRTVS